MYFLILIIILIIIYFLYSTSNTPGINTTKKQRKISSDQEKFMIDTFELSSTALNIFDLITYTKVGSHSYRVKKVNFIKDRCYSRQSYNGPKCLDGTPDLRYNTSKYGHTLSQTISYDFEFLTQNGIALKYTVDGEKLSSQSNYIDYQKLKSLKFKGRQVELSKIPTALDTLNILFYMCDEEEDFFHDLSKAIDIINNQQDINRKRNILQNRLNTKRHKLNELNPLIEKMSPEQLTSYKNLQNELDEIKQTINELKSQSLLREEELKIKHKKLKEHYLANENIYKKKLATLAESEKINKLLHT